jgi:hypothetical protein
MSATTEARALPFFTDLYGQPLDAGSIYIGQPGLDPVAYPAVVTSDLSGSTVLAQPIRTTHGHAVSAGAFVHMYVQIPYSISILDSSGRVVYTSLNETDPVATAVSSSSVQSASSYVALRARSGVSTNQVWVTSAGMYVYDAADITSPEKIPYVIVGNDGSRYKLSTQYAYGPWLKAFLGADASTQGAYFSWSDFGDGSLYLTDNRGSGTGGFVFRTVNADNSAEIGRVSSSAAGSITAGGDVFSPGVVTSTAGKFSCIANGSRGLSWDGANYQLPGSPLLVNGSAAITQASLQAAILANQQSNGVGAVALGSNTAVNPVLPGTWLQTGTSNNSVFLYVRTA